MNSFNKENIPVFTIDHVAVGTKTIRIGSQVWPISAISSSRILEKPYWLELRFFNVLFPYAFGLWVLSFLFRFCTCSRFPIQHPHALIGLLYVGLSLMFLWLCFRFYYCRWMVCNFNRLYSLEVFCGYDWIHVFSCENRAFLNDLSKQILHAQFSDVSPNNVPLQSSFSFGRYPYPFTFKLFFGCLCGVGVLFLLLLLLLGANNSPTPFR